MKVMEIKTEHCQLNSDLTLHAPSKSPLTLPTAILSLTKLDNELIECRLTCHLNPEIYQHIETDKLFNLTPEMRSPLEAFDFLPEPEIKLEISLKPDWLSHLTAYSANVNEAANYILNLSQKQLESPLLSTENWLLLSAKQPQESGERGYRTLWDYISPTLIAQAANSGIAEPISEGLETFFQDWQQNNLSAITEKATTEIIERITNFIKNFADFNLDEITKLIKDFDAQFVSEEKSQQKPTILQQLLNFFTEDDWGFKKLPGESILQLGFQGENGQWDCWAKVREEQKQFVFYSICPVKVPKPKRRAVGELIDRANYGVIIGNFEIDFTDGEIRYKTSIDVEENRLPPTIINRLVYTNVGMMDRYLPGIISVINGDASPSEAIRLIEEIELSPPLSEPAPSNNLTNNQPTGTQKRKKVKSESSSPIESTPPSATGATKSESLGRLTKEEMLRLRERWK